MNSPIRPNHLASLLLLAAGWMTMNFLSGCAITNSFSESKKIRESIQPLDSAASPSFRQAIGSLLSGSFVPGNNIVTLVNGDQIFPAMLGGIRSAKQTINFETYVFWDSPIAKQISEALAERASAGVKVNVILDAQGTNKMGSGNL